jgi:hypothetical protein
MIFERILFDSVPLRWWHRQQKSTALIFMNTRDHGCRPLKEFASTRDDILALFNTDSNAHTLLLLLRFPFFSILAHTGNCANLTETTSQLSSERSVRPTSL